MKIKLNKNNNKAKNQVPKIIGSAKNENKFNNLFNQSWEVFVIKLDEKTGKYIGKTACCALEPV